MRSAVLRIVRDTVGLPLYIEDIGGETCLSVTNDAENVVQRLIQAGYLQDGRRLFYFDTDGQLDEILIRDGRFAGFAPGPNRRGIGEYLPGNR